MFKGYKFKLLTLLLVLFSVGCSDSDNNQTATVEGDYFAIIAGVAADYGSSDISIAKAESPYDITEGYASQAVSDISVATFGEKFYRIGRFNQDNLTRYDLNNPSLVEWQFTTDDEGVETSSNPYDVVFLSENKAYILRYGLGSILIVDPSVEAIDEDDYILGSIDLSAYDSDGVPQMSAAVLHEGVLYVVMQGLDSSFAPGQAHLVAIDTATDTELDISGNELKGIALKVKNPAEIAVVGSSLYVVGIGRYERYWVPADAEYTGGIEKVSLDGFSTELLVDDGTESGAIYGNIDDIALVSATKGYFVAQVPTGSSTKQASVYEFNPTTGAVVSEALEGLSGLDVQDIAVSPEGMLWVGLGDASSPEIRVIDPEDNSLVETIAMSLNPRKIQFTGLVDLED